MTEHLKLDGISVALDGHPIVRDVSFSLESGQIGSLLGPSGCGKTTLLRAIAGFVQPNTGTIHLRDNPIASADHSLTPEHRNIGMVFQDLALFPHLTVAGNVAFGIRDQSKTVRMARVTELLELTGLEDYADSYPHELSGGQQQRVALVRAMAPQPHVLLLDEPFSGQDIELREQLAREVSGILRHDGITALLVTHDQMEAFAFADVIGVMAAGELHQWDSAYNLYHRPADRFVADFIGQGVFIRGSVMDNGHLQTDLGVIAGELIGAYPPETEVELLVRPDDVIHHDESPQIATVVEKSFRGADHLYTLELPGPTRVLCLAPSHHDHAIGESIGIKLEMDHLVVFACETD
ncbi:MAG: ABC transporter ATP-binding protein [Pseudomonadota bacterium]